MKKSGIVKEFDGYNGKIQTNDMKEYLLMQKDILNRKLLNNGDNVIFDSEKVNTNYGYKLVARFIEKDNNKKNT